MIILENSEKRLVSITHKKNRIEIEEEHQHGNLQTIIKFAGAGGKLYLERFLKEILKIDKKI